MSNVRYLKSSGVGQDNEDWTDCFEDKGPQPPPAAGEVGGDFGCLTPLIGGFVLMVAWVCVAPLAQWIHDVMAKF